jgi:hypothetical protein
VLKERQAPTEPDGLSAFGDVLMHQRLKPPAKVLLLPTPNGQLRLKVSAATSPQQRRKYARAG